MGDFTSFRFGDYYCGEGEAPNGYKQLNIIRVSDGDRYEEELHPEIRDVIAEVPGLNGEYYFGSTYGVRNFNINFVFDSLTEKEFRELRTVFGTKDVKKLIFDERPYKYYLAKIESPIELSYVCFDEPKKVRYSDLYPNSELPNGIRWVDDGYGSRILEKVNPWVTLDETQRIYKGEGKISFVCYFPFAKSEYKVLPEDSNSWAVSSGILSSNEYASIDKYNRVTGIINLYNAGDLPTGFRLYCPFNGSHSIKISYKAQTNGEIIGDLIVKEMVAKKNGQRLNNGEIEDTYDEGFLINTDNELIQGVKYIGLDMSGNTTVTTSGNIYNGSIESGHFFKLEPNLLYTDGATLTITDYNGNLINTGIEIFYDYLYF